jgi:hypothetical protein
MDHGQVGTRLEEAIQSTDHLLARYGETPHAAGTGEWLGLITVQTRELVRAASDYLESDHAPQSALYS